MNKTEKVLKWFFMLCAVLLGVFLILNIGQVSFGVYLKLLLGAVAFYFGVMIMYNLFEKKKWNHSLFRLW